MQETKCFPERNLNKEKIINRVKFYSWPYSQPRIVNTVRASSKMGTLLGFLTIPLVLSDMYQIKHLLFIDILMFLSFLILKAGIIPAIRRNQIKYTPSELRKINYYGLLFTSMIIYSAVIRVLVATGLYIFNNMKQLGIGDSLVQMLKMSVTGLPINVIILGVVLGALPIILILYPKDIKVLDYHYMLLELQKSTYQSTGYKEPEREQIPLFPTHMPQTKSSGNYYPPMGSGSFTTNTTQNTNTNRPKNSGNKTNSNGNKNSKPKTNKPINSGDIWETKISKRQRRD